MGSMPPEPPALNEVEREMMPHLSDKEIFFYAKLKLLHRDVELSLKNQEAIRQDLASIARR
jgi:hypothetical protein